MAYLVWYLVFTDRRKERHFTILQQDLARAGHQEKRRGVGGVSSSQPPQRPHGIRGLGTPYLFVGRQVHHTPIRAVEGTAEPRRDDSRHGREVPETPKPPSTTQHQSLLNVTAGTQALRHSKWQWQPSQKTYTLEVWRYPVGEVSHLEAAVDRPWSAAPLAGLSMITPPLMRDEKSCMLTLLAQLIIYTCMPYRPMVVHRNALHRAPRSHLSGLRRVGAASRDTSHLTFEQPSRHAGSDGLSKNSRPPRTLVRSSVLMTFSTPGGLAEGGKDPETDIGICPVKLHVLAAVGRKNDWSKFIAAPGMTYTRPHPDLVPRCMAGDLGIPASNPLFIRTVCKILVDNERNCQKIVNGPHGYNADGTRVTTDQQGPNGDPRGRSYNASLELIRPFAFKFVPLTKPLHLGESVASTNLQMSQIQASLLHVLYPHSSFVLSPASNYITMISLVTTPTKSIPVCQTLGAATLFPRSVKDLRPTWYDLIPWHPSKFPFGGSHGSAVVIGSQLSRHSNGGGRGGDTFAP
ncbi:uncharacterized protein CLUP02_01396 [Colletotrichum lupini]|uniref:Uncharacterized protein n=1 Tax=Colletotrichum lupini TaxID=145971 RepID=A0A9Q8SCK8_9PEZI|nr:uncharacterized protein CLUP02_01396 [Colletotrichum lupini]UQC74744.1 hypothetical protein CLUP02_01396 [Colletotrichum lupini]